jgi:hypothetical protein
MEMPEVGQRVELVHTSDTDTALRPGDRGRVTRVHDPDGGLAGPAIHIVWDSGSTLAMLPDEGDVIRVVED